MFDRPISDNCTRRTLKAYIQHVLQSHSISVRCFNNHSLFEGYLTRCEHLETIGMKYVGRGVEVGLGDWGEGLVVTDLLLGHLGGGSRGERDPLLADREVQQSSREGEEGAGQLAHLDLAPGFWLQHWLHC